MSITNYPRRLPESKITITLGDVVQDHNGFKGWVIKVHRSFFNMKEADESEGISWKEADFCTMSKFSWLNAQKNPHTPEELQQKWYSVLMFNGGSGLYPEGRLQILIHQQN